MRGNPIPGEIPADGITADRCIGMNDSDRVRVGDITVHAIAAALLPINGRDAERYRRNCIGNMTFQEAADLAGELQPELALPGHWDMFADNPGNPDAFVDYLTVKYSGRIKAFQPSLLTPIQIGMKQ